MAILMRNPPQFRKIRQKKLPQFRGIGKWIPESATGPLMIRIGYFKIATFSHLSGIIICTFTKKFLGLKFDFKYIDMPKSKR